MSRFFILKNKMLVLIAILVRTNSKNRYLKTIGLESFALTDGPMSLTLQCVSRERTKIPPYTRFEYDNSCNFILKN